jgi:DNA polymerase-3 subunit alpha
MGKKKPEEMAKQRKIFVQGAKETNEIEAKKANEIFDILEKFAGYGFNKSHSAAYGVISYQTAYLKANYPVDFMAGVLACELGNSDKLSHFISECAEMGISVLGPDVNESGENFTPLKSDHDNLGSIRFGLSAVKGVGDVAGKIIVEERAQNGPFVSFTDLVERVDGKSVNKRVLECLVKSGGFDALEGNRAALLADLDRAMGEAQLRRKDREAGQSNLFDLMGGSDDNNSEATDDFSPAQSLPDVPEMEELEKLKLEKELLGFFLSGHPIDTLGGLGPLFDTIEQKELDDLQGKRAFRLCGVVSEIERRYTKKDAKPWARFTLLAKEKDFSFPMFPEAYEQYGMKLEEGAIMVVEGVASNRDGEVRANANAVLPIDQALSKWVEEVTWLIDPDHQDALSFAKELFAHGERGFGGALIRLGIAGKGEDAGLVAEADDRFRMKITVAAFKEWRSKESVRAARVKISEPELPPERKYGRRQG